MLLLIGLIALVFALPLIVVRLFYLYETSQIYQQITDLNIEQDEGLARIIGLSNFIGLVNIPLWVFFSIGLAGIMRITKKIIWGEYLSMRHDFLLGIKENGWHFVFAFLVIAVIGFIGNYYYNRYFFLGHQSAAEGIIRFLPLAVTVTVIIPVFLFFLSMTVIYRDRFFVKIRSSIKLYLLTFPKTLTALVGCALPFSFLYIESNIFQFIYQFVLIIFFFPLIVNAWFLYSCYVFDKYINKMSFPEIVDKGIWR
ncbi:MAG: hypothetical protein PHV87_07485 [Bacilli bacterium]|nr:hypothetical protein [Bacilli bacterium]